MFFFMVWWFYLVMGLFLTTIFLLMVFFVGGVIHKVLPLDVNSFCDDNGHCYKLKFDNNLENVVGLNH